MHRLNTDVANNYDGESDFATVEGVVQRPAQIKGKQLRSCQECRDFAEPVLA